MAVTRLEPAARLPPHGPSDGSGALPRRALDGGAPPFYRYAAHMTESPSGTPVPRGAEPGSARWPRQLPVAFEDPAYLAAVVDLLGAIAYGELSAFERLSEDAKMAPRLSDKTELARMASTEFAHFEALRLRLSELGADPFGAMEPFVTPFDAFHVR